MIFCFGGYNDNKDKIHWGSLSKEGLPTYDFFDTNYGYYQNNSKEILKKIDEVAAKDGSDRFLGVSMGGFGALLFSSLSQLGPVLALSPQTTLNHLDQTDGGFAKYMRKVKDPPYPEIRLLPKPPKGSFAVYPSLHSSDTFHAKQLQSWCSVVGVESKDHGWFKKVNKEDFRASVLKWIETTEFVLRG
jgi:hypothetical protein